MPGGNIRKRSFANHCQCFFMLVLIINKNVLKNSFGFTGGDRAIAKPRFTRNFYIKQRFLIADPNTADRNHFCLDLIIICNRIFGCCEYCVAACSDAAGSQPDHDAGLVSSLLGDFFISPLTDGRITTHWPPPLFWQSL